jgi:GH18 family chitinase
MLRSFWHALVLVGLLAVANGCGGGEGGPRGGATGGGSSVGGSGPGVDPTNRPTMRTVAYLPTYHGALTTWTNQLKFQNISYVNVSFMDVGPTGTVRVSDLGLASLVQTAHAAGAKVCVALGGATTIPDGGVFATLLQDGMRPAFIDNLVAFAKNNELDCLDVDLEGNGVNDFYEAFVTELSARLHADNRELTAAVASWFGDKITAKALLGFDFINVMAYDLYDNNRMPSQTSSIEAATKQVDGWVARGMPRDRVVYGVPFYGFEWPAAGGDPKQVTYSELLRRDATAATQDQLQGSGTVIYLNSRATIQAKAQLAKTYGGIMAWEAGQDASGDASLLQAIRDVVP